MYRCAGVDLAAEPLVGVGLVCRRRHTDEIGRVFAAIRDAGVPRLLGFGVKLLDLRRRGHLLTSAERWPGRCGPRREPSLPRLHRTHQLRQPSPTRLCLGRPNHRGDGCTQPTHPTQHPGGTRRMTTVSCNDNGDVHTPPDGPIPAARSRPRLIADADTRTLDESAKQTGIVQPVSAADDTPAFIHAWGGYGRPRTGPVPGERGLTYCTTRLYQHLCGHVEKWPATTALDEEGCDACESAPVPGGWQPLYRRGDSFQDGTP
jgi:hypothetical protein